MPHRRPCLIAAMAVAASLAAAPGRAVDFLIAIDGTPAISFRGECTVIVEGTTESVEFRALVPKSYVVEGTAASCTVQKMDSFGRLDVRLMIAEEVIAQADTRASFNWVRVRSDGPWGPARGVRGTQRTILFGAPQQPEGPTVPRLVEPPPRLVTPPPRLQDRP
jgi:hypothetical protein